MLIAVDKSKFILIQRKTSNNGMAKIILMDKGHTQNYITTWDVVTHLILTEIS